MVTFVCVDGIANGAYIHTLGSLKCFCVCSCAGVGCQVLADVEEKFTPIRTCSNGGKIAASSSARRKKRAKKRELVCADRTSESGSKLSADASAETTATCESVGSREQFTTQPRTPMQWDCYRHVDQLFIRGDNIVFLSSSATKR